MKRYTVPLGPCHTPMLVYCLIWDWTGVTSSNNLWVTP